jgi:hypothetical protein
LRDMTQTKKENPSEGGIFFCFERSECLIGASTSSLPSFSLPYDFLVVSLGTKQSTRTRNHLCKCVMRFLNYGTQ